VARFGLCNLALVMLVGAVLIWPALSSFARTRELIRLQEGRIHLYNLHETTYINYGALLSTMEATAGAVAYEELTATLAEISRLAAGLGLRERSLSAAEPVGYGNVFAMRVTAVYAGREDALVALTRAVDFSLFHVQGLHMAFGEDPTVRMGFSLVGIKASEE